VDYKENRLEKLRLIIDELIYSSQADIGRYFSHLYAVSRFGVLLALRRNLNPEIAATCGMLHDIYQVTAGTSEQHAVEGAKVAEKILKEMSMYSDEEIMLITTAISRHSDKEIIHGPYDELLKDADVMCHYFYNTDFPIYFASQFPFLEKERTRYENILRELGFNHDQEH